MIRSEEGRGFVASPTPSRGEAQLDDLRNRLLAWAGCDGIADIWEAAYRRYCAKCSEVINGIVDGDMTKEDLDPRALLNVFTESLEDMDALLALGKPQRKNNGTRT